MSHPSSGVASPPIRMAPRSRTQSISSDRPSTVAPSFMSPPLSVSPEAAFIAGSAASQIVTNDHDSHADSWYDLHGVEPSGETAMVSPAALQLVNNFLDQLLFNFLSIARSTKLSALRPAVSEVLKPKLAKDAINQADEELREYLGGGEEDEESVQPAEPVSPSDWDLELVWKRTRLRCMVYSSLGDMEEEDEDYYMEQENLVADLDDRTNVNEVVSPAVAIFLTSILEFMGEQALIVAGQAAYHRMRVTYEKELKEGVRSPAGTADRIVVEELDMERVALDRTLGRLWRAWKKKIRSPGIAFGIDHALSKYGAREVAGQVSVPHLRSSSVSVEASVPPTVPEPESESEQGGAQVHEEPEEPEEPGEAEESVTPEGAKEHEDADDKEADDKKMDPTEIPLPIGSNDVNEIEVPGLVSYSDDEGEEDEAEGEDIADPVRPKSLVIFPFAWPDDLPTPTMSQPHTPAFTPRKRSNSLPTPAASPYTLSATKAAQIESIAAALDEANEPGEEHGVVTSGATEAVEVEEVQASRDDVKQAIENTVEFDAGGPVVESVTPVVESAVDAAASGLEHLADEADDENDDEDDDEAFIEEEPQIMTSSRISISGRSSSPSTSENGKVLAINTSMRPASVHSLRLIEVTSPRSPTPRSRGSSVDATEFMRVNGSSITGANISRSSSARTPPIVEERPSFDRELAPRSASLYPGRSGFNRSESISETEEAVAPGDHDEVSPLVSDEEGGPSYVATAEHGYERTRPHAQSPQPVERSRPRQVSAPASPTKPITTKVTVLPSSASTFPQEEPETDVVPMHYATHRPHVLDSLPEQQPPVVPERSPERQVFAQQHTSIGVVSVDRIRTNSPLEGPTSRSQLIEQSSAAPRQLQTSGSSSPVSSKRKAPMRNSEESMTTPTSRADVERNFEQLIHSDQTIQYTLTPEGVRDIDQSGWPAAPPSPVVAMRPRKSESEQARSPSVNKSSDLMRATSTSRSFGLNSHPVDVSLNSSKISSPANWQSPPAVPTKPRANMSQVREARLPQESTSEFADFIRSTGPTGGSVASGIPSANRTAGPSALRNASGPVPTVKNKVDSSRASTASSRTRLQARDAVVDYKDDNSDLIDFIRRGPPAVPGNHRIPRTVAPFRTTMDSDQMVGAAGGRAVDAQLRDMGSRNSQAASSITEYSQQSVHSSVTSQSALLGKHSNQGGGNNKPVAGAYGGSSSSSRFGGIEENKGDVPMPTRKSRRVRDPYAIDVSDDELAEEDEPTPKGNRRIANQPREESLAEFLRNVPPPPGWPVEQQYPTCHVVMQRAEPKKKASSQSLMARFARRGSGQLFSVGGAANASKNTVGSSSKPSLESRSLSSRASAAPSIGRGYIPIQVNIPSGGDMYGVTAAPPPPLRAPVRTATGGHAPPPVSMLTGSSAGRGGTGRVPMKRFEPREAASRGSRATSELADFFKNSEPPPMGAGGVMGQTASPAVATQEDASGGFSKVFARRKKGSIG